MRLLLFTTVLYIGMIFASWGFWLTMLVNGCAGEQTQGTQLYNGIVQGWSGLVVPLGFFWLGYGAFRIALAQVQSKVPNGFD